MGIINHECVIATAHSDEDMQKVKDWVSSIDEKYRKLFVFAPSITNFQGTVFMAPDGSKKGWDTSKEAAGIRDRFIGLIVSLGTFNWVEVGYGEFGQSVLGGNNVNCYSDDFYHFSNQY